MSNHEDKPSGNPLDQPHLRQFRDFLNELNSESERGEVLVAATVLDDQLRKAITARLIDQPDVSALVEGFNAPLGTFSARILAAFALGILSEREYRECSTIRKVRNQFAHSLGVTFETQSVADLCRNLTYSVKEAEASSVHARGQFSSAAVALILNLVNRAYYVARDRLKHQQWPY